MKTYQKRLVALAALVGLAGIAVADNSTTLGRMQLSHPNLGHTGGVALHTHIADIYTSVSNNTSSRYAEYTGVANSAVTTYTHNFGIPFADVTVVLWSGTGSSKTRIIDPVGSGWVIAAGGVAATQIAVTAPGSGGPHAFSLELYSGVKTVPVAGEVADEVLSTNGSGSYSWVKIFNANVDASAAISRSKLAAGTASHVVVNDGSGVLSSEAQLAATRGGTGADLSAATGVVQIATGVFSASAIDLATADVTGTLPIGNGGTGQTSQTAAFNALDPLTTKGDLVTHDGINSVRRAVGTDGFALVADSAQTTGLNWSSVLTNPLLDGLFIDGSADEIQLQVQAQASPQTADVAVFESAAGTDYVAVKAGGQLLVNGASLLTGAVGTPKLSVQQTVNGGLMLSRDSVDNGGSTFEFLKRRTAFGLVSSGDRITELRFTAADGTDAASAASLIVELDGTPGADDMPGRLIFSTSPDGSQVVTERLRIDSAGLATFSGNVALSTNLASIRTNTTAGTDDKSISFAGGGAVGVARGAYVNVNGNQAANAGDIQFAAGDNGGSLVFYTGSAGALVERVDISAAATYFGGGTSAAGAVGGDGMIQYTQDSPGSPTYSFAGDDDTGFDQATAGEGHIALITQGTERVRVSNTGQITFTAAADGGNVPHNCAIESSQATLSTGTQEVCAAGKIVTGGGCSITAGGTAIGRSYPINATTWRCDTSTAVNSTIDVYAICCTY